MSVGKLNASWMGLTTVSAKSFRCGYCGSSLSSEKAFFATEPGYTGLSYARAYIYICHTCNMPTFFDRQHNQTPGPLLGNPIRNLPGDIESLYNEIRRSTAANSYTAAVLASRKLLMHIAVSHGADEGKSFAFYIKYLSDNHYTPPKSKKWVDSIRTSGNEANHEIKIMKLEEAQQIIKLVELILVFNYEYADSEDEE